MVKQYRKCDSTKVITKIIFDLPPLKGNDAIKTGMYVRHSPLVIYLPSVSLMQYTVSEITSPYLFLLTGMVVEEALGVIFHTVCDCPIEMFVLLIETVTILLKCLLVIETVSVQFKCLCC